MVVLSDDEETFRLILAAHIDECWDGNQSAFSREAGVSAAYTNDVIHGRRHPGKKIAAYFDMTPTLEFKKQGEPDGLDR